MKIEEFDYTKKTGEQSHRKIMVLNNHKEYVDGLDLDKLTAEEIITVLEIQEKYENALKPFVEKAFRRFNKSNMTNVFMENAKENGKDD